MGRPSQLSHVEKGNSTRGLITFAYVAVLLLIGGVGGLAAAISISGAVVAPGRLVVSSYPKPVQHLKGGIVDSVFVKNGDRVENGQLLVRLDDTQTRASLAIVTKRLNELTVRGARLASEQDGASTIAFPPGILSQSKQVLEIGDLMASEEKVFAARKLSQTRRKEQLHERVNQLYQQIGGLEAQRIGKKQEIALIQKEKAGVEQLVSQQLLSATRLNELQREEARLTGELGGLISSIAETRGKITETELQILQIDDDIRSEAASDLRDVQAQIGEFSERKISAEDDLKHVDIRAPQAGVVHQLSIHAAGAVISPASPIMLIVPVDDNLIVEARIAPNDIDQLALGQKAELRFSAFNQRTTPEINGAIVEISADLTTEQQSGQSFYTVRVRPDDADLGRFGDLKLIPGMPVEAFIQTGDRTILSYLLKPATDQISRAFREE